MTIILAAAAWLAVPSSLYALTRIESTLNLR
jgi:hypothetical protein